MGRSRDLADGTLAELNVDSNTLAVDATNNNVGIGTSSPDSSNKLQVTGDIGLDWATDKFIGMKFGSGGSYKMGLMLKDTSRECKVWSQSVDSDDKITFYTGSTPSERMRIDSSGRVTMPYQPMFTAVSTTNTNIAGGTPVIVPLSGTFVNVGSHYNTSTYRFTAPVAGKYEISLSAMMNSTQGAGANASLRLYKNGSGLTYSHINGAHPASGAFTVIVTAAANDYFEFYAENIYRQTGNYITTFSGKLIG